MPVLPLTAQDALEEAGQTFGGNIGCAVVHRLDGQLAQDALGPLDLDGARARDGLGGRQPRRAAQKMRIAARIRMSRVGSEVSAILSTASRWAN